MLDIERGHGYDDRAPSDRKGTMSQKHDVSIMTPDGNLFGISDVEFNFDADKKVIYLFSEQGFSYVNFDQILQFGAIPASN